MRGPVDRPEGGPDPAHHQDQGDRHRYQPAGQAGVERAPRRADALEVLPATTSPSARYLIHFSGDAPSLRTKSVGFGRTDCGRCCRPLLGLRRAPQRIYRPEVRKNCCPIEVQRVGAGFSPIHPLLVRRIGRPCLQLGPVGARRPDRHPQPHRRAGPTPGGGRGTPRFGLRPRAAAVGRGGHPGRIRRGPGQPDQNDGGGQRPAEPRPGVDRLVRGRGHHGHPVRHPLGRARPRVLRVRAGRGAALQRLPGRHRHRRRGGQARHPPGRDTGVAWPAARRRPVEGPRDPRARLPDHPRRPRRGLCPRRASPSSPATWSSSAPARPPIWPSPGARGSAGRRAGATSSPTPGRPRA